jgi:uncharacterized protein
MSFQVIAATSGGRQAGTGYHARAGERALVAVSLVLLGAVAVLPAPNRYASLSTHGWLLTLQCVSIGVAIALGRWEAIHLTVIGAVYLAAYCLPVVGTLWPLPLVVILASYAAVFALVPAARKSARYLRRGSIDRVSAVWAILFTITAAIALLAWRYGADVDMTRYRQFVPPNVPRWAMFAGILPFAMFNAVFEELVWRGVVWQAGEGAFGRTAALILSSLSFGVAHYRGFPSGVLGVALATIFGLMMGLVRMRTGGLLGPWLAHVFADVVIFTMIVAMVACG